VFSVRPIIKNTRLVLFRDMFIVTITRNTNTYVYCVGGQIAGFVYMTVGGVNRNHLDAAALISASHFISSLPHIQCLSYISPLSQLDICRNSPLTNLVKCKLETINWLFGYPVYILWRFSVVRNLKNQSINTPSYSQVFSRFMNKKLYRLHFLLFVRATYPVQRM